MRPSFLKAFPTTLIFPKLSIGFCNKPLNALAEPGGGADQGRYPRIPLGRRFWALTVAEDKEIARLVALPETQELIT